MKMKSIEKIERQLKIESELLKEESLLVLKEFEDIDL